MAVKTKAQILAEIAALFADNTTGDISASDLRTVTTDIVDSYSDAPYSKLVWNIKQIGTSNPVFNDASGNANPLENTLGEVPVLARSGIGTYTLTVVASLFEKNKLWCPFINTVGSTGVVALTIIDSGGVGGYIYLYRSSDTVITIRSVDETFTLADISTLITNDVISMPEIRSYI